MPGWSASRPGNRPRADWGAGVGPTRGSARRWLRTGGGDPVGLAAGRRPLDGQHHVEHVVAELAGGALLVVLAAEGLGEVEDAKAPAAGWR